VDAGLGGRNQQFAAYCATKIKNENITVLSAGTDGIDGSSPAAGAVVDGDTLTRYAELLKHSDLNKQTESNLQRELLQKHSEAEKQSKSKLAHASFESALRHFDTYPAFNALGDAIITGPTGNNVRDLRILMAY
jgi:hydroxypyruvate reductase